MNMIMTVEVQPKYDSDQQECKFDGDLQSSLGSLSRRICVWEHMCVHVSVLQRWNGYIYVFKDTCVSAADRMSDKALWPT